MATNRERVYVSNLHELSTKEIESNGHYDIFQLNGTPSPVIHSVTITDDNGQPTGEGRTPDVAGWLNNLQGFKEIDFFANTPGNTQHYHGLDIEQEFQVDASLLHIKKLGVIASGDDATFSNLSADNLVIAKDGTAQGGSSTVFLNLGAERQHHVDLNPYDAKNSSGEFTDGGVVRAEIRDGVNAIVTENLKFENDSDYHKLILTGVKNSSTSIENYAADTYGEALNDHSVVDASGYRGTFYDGNAASVSETMIFGSAKDRGIDHTNLAGSIYSHMDVVKGVHNFDFLDISGNYTPTNDYAYDGAYTAVDATAEHLTGFHFASLKAELDYAANMSARDAKTVWFVNDGNTFVVDHNGSTPPTITATAALQTSGPPPIAGNGVQATDHVIEIAGVHNLVDNGLGHLVVQDSPHWDLFS